MPSTTRIRTLAVVSIAGAVAAAMLTGVALGQPAHARAASPAPSVAAPAPSRPAPADAAPATSKAAGAQKPAPASPVAPAVSAVSVRSNIGDGTVYGVGIPVVLTFNHAIPMKDRAAVQKRLSVTSTPAQPGAWRWFSDREVHYRPQQPWQAGSTISVRANLAGLTLSTGYVGRHSLSVDAHITAHPLSISINARKHSLVVVRDGQIVKVMKASLGKTSTPSSSGNMVVMTRQPSQIFDSSLGGGTPVDAPGGYRELVKWTMRLTWGGEFIHAAPWSVSAQGHRNVSHGCTNLSDSDAQWLYENSHIGDPVTVTGTSRALQSGNGWTDWDMSWSQYADS